MEDEPEDKLLSIDINLSLTRAELNQFYWVAFGASLAEYNKTPHAKEGYYQIIEQIESFFIKEDPDNIFKMEQIKEAIIKSINKKKD